VPPQKEIDMVKEIIRYEAKDGTQFESENAAIEQDIKIDLKEIGLSQSIISGIMIHLGAIKEILKTEKVVYKTKDLGYGQTTPGISPMYDEFGLPKCAINDKGVTT
jgi:hypothetical protein